MAYTTIPEVIHTMGLDPNFFKILNAVQVPDLSISISDNI